MLIIPIIVFTCVYFAYLFQLLGRVKICMFVDVVVYASIFLCYIYIYTCIYIYIQFSSFVFLVELGLRNNWDQPDSTCIIVYIYNYIYMYIYIYIYGYIFTKQYIYVYIYIHIYILYTIFKRYHRQLFQICPGRQRFWRLNLRYSRC